MPNNETIHPEALELLEDPELLDRASDAMDRLGLCGEEANRKMIFLAGVGGIVGCPIHLVVHGESSGGKNTVVRIPLRLLPEHQVTEVTGLSAHALEYAEEDLDGVLVIHEAEGQEDAEYAVRIAMSEGQVTRLTVLKDESGRLSGEQVGTEVNCSIITTTTSASLHQENQTRVFDLWIDESEEQTRRILAQKARAAAGGDSDSDIDDLLAPWHHAIEALEPASVKVPYAGLIAGSFPSGQVRARRDFERLIGLIRGCALLHQKQRLKEADETIRASPRDYELVYPLIQAVLEPSMQGLNETALELCALHDELAGEQSSSWVRRPELETLAGKRGVASRNTVHKWCKELARLGYWQGRRSGRFGAWEHKKLRDPQDEPVSLPTPSELREMVAAADGAPSLEIDWEASENPRNDRKRSSHPPDWEELGPGDENDKAGTVNVPSDLVDGTIYGNWEF